MYVKEKDTIRILLKGVVPFCFATNHLPRRILGSGLESFFCSDYLHLSHIMATAQPASFKKKIQKKETGSQKKNGIKILVDEAKVFYPYSILYFQTRSILESGEAQNMR